MVTIFENSLRLTEKEATDILRHYAMSYINVCKKYPDAGLINSANKLGIKESVYDVLNQIILNTQVEVGSDNKFIVKVKDKKLDRLARMITYGSLGIRGNNILLDSYCSAFKHL